MTREELNLIFSNINETVIQPEEAMNLAEMKTYVKGYEDARNAFYDSADRCYRSLKTD